MRVESDTIAAMNRDFAELRITPARLEDLRIEIDQLACGAYGVRARLEFDLEPSDFLTALLAMAARYSHG